MQLVGGKAANLGVMAGQLGCRSRRASSSPPRPASTYLADGWPGLDDEIRTHMAAGRGTRRAAGSATPPTRCWSASGPARRVSMPGMMDTILNLGLNEETCAGLAAATGDAGVRRTTA